MSLAREQFYLHEKLLHELTAESIHQLLESSAWQTCDQSISSKETNNDNQIEPSANHNTNCDNTCSVDAFADLDLPPNTTILDVGGGKFDGARNYVKTKWNIDLLIWDPYNRPAEHNTQVRAQVEQQKTTAATSMSVLNVIPDIEARLAHINTLKSALQIAGVAYFKIWPGEGDRKKSYLPSINSYGHPGYQANAGADRFLREVQIVFGLENVEIHKTIPNLIVAVKQSERSTSIDEINHIQTLSKTDPWLTLRSEKPSTRFIENLKLFKTLNKSEISAKTPTLRLNKK